MPQGGVQTAVTFQGGSKIDQATWDEFFDTTTMRIDAQSLEAENRRLWGSGVKSDRLTVEVLEAEEKRLAEKPLDALLAQYAARPQNLKPRRQAQQAISYDRDPLVVILRKRLAGYRCEVEGCQSEQFRTVTKEFFVEVHHLVPLAEGGPDTLENTVAVCATHHRFLHHGQERKNLTAKLTAKRDSDSSKSPP